jgi:hypothetical protein
LIALDLAPDPKLLLVDAEIAQTHTIAEVHLQEVEKTVTSEARVLPTMQETDLLLLELARQSRIETGAEAEIAM